MGSVVPLMILSMLIIAIGLSNLTGVQMLIGMGFDKLFLYSVLTGAISNFALNCLLIPLLGATGASIASVVAETFVLIVTLSFVYLRTKIKIDRWIDVVKSFLGALLFIPLLFSLKSFLNGWWLVVVFVVTGGVVYSLSELILKNGSFALFKNVAENSISSIKSRCYAIL